MSDKLNNTHGQVQSQLQLGDTSFAGHSWSWQVPPYPSWGLTSYSIISCQSTWQLALCACQLPSEVVVTSAGQPPSDDLTAIRSLRLSATSLEDLWTRCPDLCQPPAGPAVVKHQTAHHIETRGPPQVSRPRLSNHGSPILSH